MNWLAFAGACYLSCGAGWWARGWWARHLASYTQNQDHND